MPRRHAQQHPRRARRLAPSLFPVVQRLDGNAQQFRKLVLRQPQPRPRGRNGLFPLRSLFRADTLSDQAGGGAIGHCSPRVTRHTRAGAASPRRTAFACRSASLNSSNRSLFTSCNPQSGFAVVSIRPRSNLPSRYSRKCPASESGHGQPPSNKSSAPRRACRGLWPPRAISATRRTLGITLPASGRASSSPCTPRQVVIVQQIHHATGERCKFFKNH